MKDFIDTHWGILSQLFFTKRSALLWMKEDREMWGGTSAEKLILANRGHKVLAWFEVMVKGY